MFVFKSCQNDYIVVLQKLDDSKTNEHRKDVVDARYAKFRADRLIVVRIYNKCNGEEIQTITNSVYSKKTITYTCNEIVEVTDYDEDINKVCSSGIHYFKTEEAAKY